MELGKEVIEVSIILRSKNVERLMIENLYEKIAADLNSHKYEVVLVDDSIEQTCLISQENLKVVKTGGGKGPNRALELGAKNAKYQFCAIQDDDDPYVGGRILEQISKLISSGMVYCVAPVVKVTSSGRVIPQPFGLINYENYSTNWLLLGSYGGDASLVWDQKKSGPLCLPKDIDNFGDWVWGLENLWDSNTTYSTQTRYLYKQHSGQLTRHLKNLESELPVLFYSWRNRQKNLNLPVLNDSDLKFIIKPRVVSKLKNRRSEIRHVWFRNFLEEMKNNDRCNNELEILVSRKLALSTIGSGEVSWLSISRLMALFDAKFISEVILAFRYRR